jgi:hypothetical protein
MKQVSDDGKRWSNVKLHDTTKYDADDDWEVVEMAGDLPSEPHGDSAPGYSCLLM